jgi:hypothetical protein
MNQYLFITWAMKVNFASVYAKRTGREKTVSPVLVRETRFRVCSGCVSGPSYTSLHASGFVASCRMKRGGHHKNKRTKQNITCQSIYKQLKSVSTCLKRGNSEDGHGRKI